MFAASAPGLAGFLPGQAWLRSARRIAHPEFLGFVRRDACPPLQTARMRTSRNRARPLALFGASDRPRLRSARPAELDFVRRDGSPTSRLLALFGATHAAPSPSSNGTEWIESEPWATVGFVRRIGSGSPASSTVAPAAPRIGFGRQNRRLETPRAAEPSPPRRPGATLSIIVPKTTFVPLRSTIPPAAAGGFIRREPLVPTPM